MGDCSFGGVSFWAHEAGELLRQGWPKRPTLARRRAPWGSRTVTQVLGYDVQPVTFTLELAKSDEPTLRGLVATLGTLALVGGISYTNVMLDELGDVKIDDTNAVAFVQATFSRAG
jgi:hypothetical protein